MNADEARNNMTDKGGGIHLPTWINDMNSFISDTIGYKVRLTTAQVDKVFRLYAK
jgi:hypothetical protein